MRCGFPDFPVTEWSRAMMDFAPDCVTDARKAIYRIYRDTRRL